MLGKNLLDAAKATGVILVLLGIAVIASRAPEWALFAARVGAIGGIILLIVEQIIEWRDRRK